MPSLKTILRPESAIYLILVLLPAYLIRFSLWGIPLTLLEVLILLLTVIYFFYRPQELKNCRLNPFFWPALVWLLLGLLAIFVSPNLRGALGIFKAYFVEPVLFFFVFTSIIKNEAQSRCAIFALGLSAVWVSLFALWQKFSAWGVPLAFLNADGSVDRVVSVFGYPNALGLLLGPIIVLFAFLLVRDIRKIKLCLFDALVIILSLITIVLAQSEGALLSVFLVLAISALIYRPTRFYALTIIIFSGMMLLIDQGLATIIWQKITLGDYSGQIRRLIWNETWQMLKDHWFFGAGLAGYQTAVAPYHLKTFEIYLYPHNIVLNFWSELGLLGLIGFVWLEIKFFLLNLKNKSWLALALVAAIAELLIHGLVDAPYFKNDLSVLFWTLLALSVVNFNNLKK